MAWATCNGKQTPGITSHTCIKTSLYMYPRTKKINMTPCNWSRKATNCFQEGLIMKSQCVSKLLKSTTFSWDPIGMPTRPCSKSAFCKILHKGEYYPNPTRHAIHKIVWRPAPKLCMKNHGFEWSFSQLPARRPGPCCLQQLAIESWAEQNGPTTALLSSCRCGLSVCNAFWLLSKSKSFLIIRNYM